MDCNVWDLSFCLVLRIQILCKYSIAVNILEGDNKDKYLNKLHLCVLCSNQF